METTQGKEVKKIKLNVTNINSFLKKSNKDYVAIKKNNKRLVSDQNKIKKTKEKEKTIEKKGLSGSSPLSNVKQVAESSAGIFDKILSFGGILLSGILLNALPSIKKKVDKFAKDNEEIIGNVTKSLIVVKDFGVNLFNAFTGPYSQENSLDWLGKFNDSGKLESGVLKKVEQAFDGVGKMINDIDKALGGEGKIGNFVITGERILAKQGGQTGEYNLTTKEFTPRAFTEEENRRYQSGDFRPESSDPKNTATPTIHGLVNPTPNTNILENKGGYAADTGLDIIGKTGDPIVSPVDGILEYAERGHTAQMGQDSDPTKPGIQDQLSFRIRLDSPFTFEGKKVNFVYGTHLSTLDPAVANKSNISIKAGQRLGTMGVANNVPHLHIGFIEDRLQTKFLNFQEVRRLLSGQSSKKSKLGAFGLPKGIIKDEKNKQALKVSSNTTTSKNNQISMLNTTVGEKGSTTIIHARQPILT